GDAFGNPSRMSVGRRHQRDAVTEADPVGALRAGGEEDLGGRGVRVFLEEMVLDLPDVVDAEPVGQLDLIERIVIEPPLGVVIPGGAGRLRQLVFVEQAEFHRGDLSKIPTSQPSLLAGEGDNTGYDTSSLQATEIKAGNSLSFLPRKRGRVG